MVFADAGGGLEAGWRLSANEAYATGFNVYRGTAKPNPVASAPVFPALP
jgi:hypothetical protein